MSDLGPVDPGRGADLAWLRRWRLRPEGDALTTPSSTLVPVRTEDGERAMLKLARIGEVVRATDLMVALDGDGAARVLRREGRAVLLEWANGPGDLVAMVRSGSDDDATRILCSVAARWHANTTRLLALREPPDLVDLESWFRELFAHADELRPLHRAGATLARRLLDERREPAVLHGDLHHANVLDFGARGWLAIDPMGLIGDEEFDVCNVLCNPHELALDAGRLARQFAVVVEATGFDERRLRDWLVAWCALSSTWFAIDDDPERSEIVERIGELAAGLP